MRTYRAFILKELVQPTEGLTCKKKVLFGNRKQQYFSLLDLCASLEQDRHRFQSCDSAYTEGLSAYLPAAGEAGVLEHGKWTGLHETSAQCRQGSRELSENQGQRQAANAE